MAETYRRNIAAAEEEIAGLQTALEELAVTISFDIHVFRGEV